VVLFMVDASDTDLSWRTTLHELHGKAREIWLVINKIDLAPGIIGKIIDESNLCKRTIYLSVKNREGYQALADALVERVKTCTVNSGESNSIVTNERQRNCLSHAANFLHSALNSVSTKQPLEILSVDIRSALTALEELVGKTYTEDILGRIFSKFCIGK
jgi:tRNA modification GTPase